MSDLKFRVKQQFDVAERALQAAREVAPKGRPMTARESRSYRNRMGKAIALHQRAEATAKQAADRQLRHRSSVLQNDIEDLQAIAMQKVRGPDGQPSLRQMAKNYAGEIVLKQSDHLRHRDGNTLDWSERREYQTLGGTDASGLATVETSISSSFFDALGSVEGIRAAGATMLVTDKGEDMQLPIATEHDDSWVRGTSTVASLLLARNEAFPERDPGTEVADLTLFKTGGYARVARELIEDSSVDIGAYVGRMLGRDLALKIERSLAMGSGSTTEPDGWNSPTTVEQANISGTGNVRRIETAASNQIAHADLVKVVKAVGPRADSPAWLMNRTTAGDIANLRSTEGIPVFRESPFADDGRLGMLLGYPVYPAVECGDQTVDNDIVLMFGSMAGYAVRMLDKVSITVHPDTRYLEDEIDYVATARFSGRFTEPSAFAWLRAKS